MHQYRAIGKKMTSIKLEEVLPPEHYWYIRQCLMEMYVVGWEQGRMDVSAHSKKPVGQYSKDTGKLINIFSGIKEACRITHFPRTSVTRAINSEKAFRGFYWKWIEVEEYEKADRDKFMY